MHSNQENVNYWPGFVDAIMNVLLNILFMLCIMAFGLGLVQNKVRESANASDTPKDTNAKNTSKDSPKPLTFPNEEMIATFDITQIKLKASPTQGLAVSPALASVSATLSEQNTVALEFTQNSPQMSQGLKEHIKTLLPQIAQTHDTIVVWAVDNEEIPNTNKLLFRHLMTVRNALIESGITPNRIEVHMVPGETKKTAITVYFAPVQFSPSTLAKQ